MSPFSLLRQRRFGPFFLTQFLGAFNDNLFKNALLVLITFHAASASDLDSATLVNMSAGLFILPFFLFSALAGQLADKYEKSMLMRRIKLAEIGIMLVAVGGFLTGTAEFLMVMLFLMGTQSAFFGPAKYAILPQHLHEEELVGGNALVEMGTFLAILFGTILGGPLVDVDEVGAYVISTALIVVATAGWLASRRIPLAPAVSPALDMQWNLAAETWRIIQSARGNRTVFLSILGISWFWFYGATFLAQMPGYARDVLGGDQPVFTLLVTTFSFGIGLGSLLCERLSGRVIEIGLVPFGAIGLSLFAFDLWLASPSPGAATGLGAVDFLARPGSWRVVADLGLIALFGGLYIVPLYALVQHRSDPGQRARVIASNNILNALFMVVSALMAIGLLKAGLSIPQLFLVLALMNAAVALYIFTLIPEFLMRFIVWLLIHTIYRLEVENIERVPERGPAVLACNHVSFVDALIITAACQRPIRFVMYHRIYKLPVLRFVFRTNRAIPIAPKSEDAQMMNQAFDEIAAALEAGELVGIFPEGAITEDGELNTFRTGIERIVERTPVPVIPLALRGLWGSFFSRRDGKAMSKPLRLVKRLWSRVSLIAGDAIPPEKLRVQRLQQTVLALRGDWK